MKSSAGDAGSRVIRKGTERRGRGSSGGSRNNGGGGSHSNNNNGRSNNDRSRGMSADRAAKGRRYRKEDGTRGAGRPAAANGSAAVRTTGIVTAFVRDVRTDKVLLLRRSNRVRTMRGKWSGVSGIIEGNEKPLNRAKTEIFEEAGISKSKIRLIRSADGIRIKSPQYRNHEWVVSAFLFEADNPPVRLNWENSDYRWVKIVEMGKYETVPDLYRVMSCLI
ncbi:MAG: NUDIX domain-containing protein [Thaumarchaeota archaeon]|nr:NUDIX domain-containing protein [Nitrososphaerota archaeon]